MRLQLLGLTLSAAAIALLAWAFLVLLLSLGQP